MPGSITNLKRLGILRITALWAFSESTFGGILHALRVPFRGMFISSAAVLFISLIALFSKNQKDILKSTIIVILIKAVVSPYTPLTAYLAVSLQGILGFLFFSTKRFYKLSALCLGITVLFFSGVQKIIVITILFGSTLWNSLDIFIKQVSFEILGITYTEINYGYTLVSTYILIHLVAGFFIGIYAGKIPQKVNYYRSFIDKSMEEINFIEIFTEKKRIKKIWLLRPTGIFIIVLLTGIITLSYLSPGLGNNVAMSVVVMLLRSIVITFIWYFLLAPITKYLFLKYISKKKSEYSQEVEEIISMFPGFRRIVNYCWKLSSSKKGFNRIRFFLTTSFYSLLLNK